jgi:bacterioferritin
MKGDAKVISHLQAQLKNELTAINQYFVHYRMLKHWGFDKLAAKEYTTACSSTGVSTSWPPRNTKSRSAR